MVIYWNNLLEHSVSKISSTRTTRLDSVKRVRLMRPLLAQGHQRVGETVSDRSGSSYTKIMSCSVLSRFAGVSCYFTTLVRHFVVKRLLYNAPV